MLKALGAINVKKEFWKGYPLEFLGGERINTPADADVGLFFGKIPADDLHYDFYIYVNPKQIMEDKPRFSWEFTPDPGKEFSMNAIKVLDKHVDTDFIVYGDTVDSILMEDEKPVIVKINRNKGISIFLKAILPAKRERYRKLSLRINELLKKYLSEKDRFMKFMLKAERTNPSLLKITQGSVIIDTHNEKTWEFLAKLTESIFLNPLDHLLPNPQTVYETFDKQLL